MQRSVEDDSDPLERYEFYTSGPFGRWLINRDRAKEGKPPLRRR